MSNPKNSEENPSTEDDSIIPQEEETVKYWLQKTVNFIIKQGLIGVKLPEAQTVEEAKDFYNELVVTLDNVRRACEAVDKFDGHEIS